eukprot:COSAG01_NODE_2079_length_8464_cov_7.812821_1_plen_24_part_10
MIKIFYAGLFVLELIIPIFIRRGG